MASPKISIIIPCYNVQQYLRECLDSVVNQTLQDIQIICVNDGSKDSTPEILEEYALRDSRIQIISKDNSGYGDSMNRGFDAAEGEYLGIVESDDYVEPDMFERLYEAAVKNDLDVCKAGFYRYSTVPQVNNTPDLTAVKIAGRNVFCPATDFRSPRRQAAFFTATAAIWAGIYRRDFIRKNHIRFNPTPGASYQDVGFSFKVWARAKRVQFLNCCLHHYRIDNDASSVHSTGKVYCVCDEFEEVVRFLRQDPADLDRLLPVMVCAKYNSYIWNYERLIGPNQEAFLLRFYEEFRQHCQDGVLVRSFFPWYFWNNLQMILLDPQRYHEIQTRKMAGEPAEDFYDAYPERRPFKGKLTYYLMENLSGATHYLNASGVSAVAGLFVKKVKHHLEDLSKKQKV